jgi:hypothetical protein
MIENACRAGVRAGSSPVAIDNVVVLPAPFGPYQPEHAARAGPRDRDDQLPRLSPKDLQSPTRESAAVTLHFAALLSAPAGTSHTQSNTAPTDGHAMFEQPAAWVVMSWLQIGAARKGAVPRSAHPWS